MNREEIEKMLNKEFIALFQLDKGENYGDIINVTDEVKSFFFDTILPEVLRDIIGDFIDESKPRPVLENSFERGAIFGHNEKLRKIQMEAKEKYNINL